MSYVSDILSRTEDSPLELSPTSKHGILVDGGTILCSISSTLVVFDNICVQMGIYTSLGISFHVLFDNIVKSRHKHRSFNFFFSWMTYIILENLFMS